MPLPKCTNKPRHLWVWKRDTTLTTNPSPGMTKFSRRGIYQCECGAKKYGQPRSGL